MVITGAVFVTLLVLAMIIAYAIWCMVRSSQARYQRNLRAKKELMETLKKMEQYQFSHVFVNHPNMEVIDWEKEGWFQ